MYIGNVKIEGKAVLAPLAGITDLPFRLICKELGAGLVCSEMIAAEGLVRAPKRTRHYLDTDAAEKPVSFQIFGNKIESMARAADIVSDTGADIIDINMGCPVRKVVGSGSGSALMKDIDKAEGLIRAVVGASRLPVTVKLRTGWFDADFVAPEFARMSEAAGVAAVAIHGRSARQGFTGKADWSRIAAVKAAVRIPVIGNGDILSAQDAARMIDETGCDLVMIGRGTLGNPWIFRDINEYLSTGTLPPRPTPVEKGLLLVRHLRQATARMGELPGVRFMRKHGAWCSKGLFGASEFRAQINHANTSEEFERFVRGFFIERTHVEGFAVEDGWECEYF